MHFIASRFMFFILVLMSLFQPFATQASAGVDNTKNLCVNATYKYEKEFNIKPHLLTTISHVEAGRFSGHNKISSPWPWTINVKGKGMYFASKAEAVKKVKELQKEGHESIDIGCMQVNLRYHGEAFSSVEEAFDVDSNVKYAATFLTKLYRTNNRNWDVATMKYHSSTPTKGARYKRRIDAQFKLLKDFFAQSSLLASNVKKSPKTKKVATKAQAWREAKLEEYRRSKKLAQNI